MAEIYDSPHLLFFTAKSIKKLAEIHNLDIVNLTFSAYSFENDHKYQRGSQQEYYNSRKKSFQFYNLKNIKKINSTKNNKFSSRFYKNENIRKDFKLNWFINNTGDNCYIRGILKKKDKNKNLMIY